MASTVLIFTSTRGEFLIWERFPNFIVVNSLNFYACCLEDILSVKAEWTLETLLKVGEGKKSWNCDWNLGKQDDGSKFKVPVDGSLKGSVIQVVKAVRPQIVFKPLKL